MAKILVIDNYDSFAYNLVQRLGSLGAEVVVYRNDKITVEDIEEMIKNDCLTHIVISPGPCTPTESGISLDIVRHFAGRLPILGICLGHQCIAQVFGAKIIRGKPVHGKTNQIEHDGKGLFEDVKNPFIATRYHSLVVECLPDCFEVTAWNKEGIVMGVRHKDFPNLDGIQVHPESILTTEGFKILQNFIDSKSGSYQH